MTRPAPSSLARTQAVVAVILLFGVNGLIIGGYGGVLPSLRARLGLDPTQIAITLVVGGACAIAAMQIGGRLSDTVGARRVALSGLPLLIAAAVVIALAPSLPVLIVGAGLLGLGNGAMDVSMNAVGVQVEAARQRPIMSRFHACWSIGNLIGAGSVLLVSRLFGLDGAAVIAPVLITLAVLAAAGLGTLFRIVPVSAPVPQRVDGVRAKIPPAAWMLGLMALGFGLSEGTAVDWSALHVTDVARVDPTTGSIGLVAVAGFMVVIRLLGDRLVARFGRRAVVRAGAACAAVGYLVVALVDPLPLLVVGWCLVGFGVGMIAPQVYAAAGHLGGGRVLAVVVTFGYAAFLTGPGLMGFVVNHVGIHHAMVVPAVLCVGIVALAAVMPREDADLG